MDCIEREHFHHFRNFHSTLPFYSMFSERTQGNSIPWVLAYLWKYVPMYFKVSLCWQKLWLDMSYSCWCHFLVCFYFEVHRNTLLCSFVINIVCKLWLRYPSCSVLMGDFKEIQNMQPSSPSSQNPFTFTLMVPVTEDYKKLELEGIGRSFTL